MPTEFINADLEITSQEGLEPIRAEFSRHGDRFVEMYVGEIESGFHFASFEIHLDEDQDDQIAEEKIHGFCDSIEKLQGLPRDVWFRATKRVIDLGYQSGDDCEPFKDNLTTAALQRLKLLGIELALTIYPHEI